MVPGKLTDAQRNVLGLLADGAERSADDVAAGLKMNSIVGREAAQRILELLAFNGFVYHERRSAGRSQEAYFRITEAGRSLS